MPDSGRGTSDGDAGACEGRFTNEIFAPDSLSVVTPIGLIGGGGTEIVGRSYMFPKIELRGRMLPLYAPTAMTLYGGTRYEPLGAPEEYVPDWSLFFISDCDPDVQIELYHIKDVVESIHAVVGDEVQASSAWVQLPAERRVHFEAGELFAYYIPAEGSVAWDFIVHDLSVTNVFVNNERYTAARSNLLHIVCPFQFFTPAIRAEYEALLGAPGGGPVEGTSCGSVAVDVVGSIAGQWFWNEDSSSGIGPLALEDGYGNPHPIVLNPDRSITFGNVGPSIQGVRIYDTDPTWHPPSEVTGEHCYQINPLGTPEGYLYYALTSSNEMTLYYGSSGSCPSTRPSSGGHVYYR